jgi:hypothetical protein
MAASSTTAATCSSDSNRNGAWSAERLVTPAADQARAGTTAIWKSPRLTLSITGPSEAGGSASELALTRIATVIDPPDSVSTWRLNSANGRLLGLPAGCESAIVIAIGPGLPPAFAPGLDDVSGPLVVPQPTASRAARLLTVSHRVRALIIASLER